MVKYVKAYLYEGKTVVIDKHDIKNAKNDDFTEVSLYLTEEFIKDSADELEMLSDEEEEEI